MDRTIPCRRTPFPGASGRRPQSGIDTARKVLGYVDHAPATGPSQTPGTSTTPIASSLIPAHTGVPSLPTNEDVKATLGAATSMTTDTVDGSIETLRLAALR